MFRVFDDMHTGHFSRFAIELKGCDDDVLVDYNDNNVTYDNRHTILNGVYRYLSASIANQNQSLMYLRVYVRDTNKHICAYAYCIIIIFHIIMNKYIYVYINQIGRTFKLAIDMSLSL